MARLRAEEDQWERAGAFPGHLRAGTVSCHRGRKRACRRAAPNSSGRGASSDRHRAQTTGSHPAGTGVCRCAPRSPRDRAAVSPDRCRGERAYCRRAETAACRCAPRSPRGHAAVCPGRRRDETGACQCGPRSPLDRAAVSPDRCRGERACCRRAETAAWPRALRRLTGHGRISMDLGRRVGVPFDRREKAGPPRTGGRLVPDVRPPAGVGCPLARAAGRRRMAAVRVVRFWLTHGPIPNARASAAPAYPGDSKMAF